MSSLKRSFFPETVAETSHPPVMHAKTKHFYQFGAFRLDTVRRRLMHQDQVITLAPKAYELLLLLLENRARVVEKDELISSLWPDSIVEESNLTQNIYLVRKALGEEGQKQSYIETVPRRGYRFTVPVEETWDENTEGIVEAHPLARFPVVAEPEAASAEKSPAPPLPSGIFPPYFSAAPRRRRRLIGWLALGLAVIVVGLVVFDFVTSRLAVKTEPGGMIQSVAVLPFKSIGAEEQDNYLGLGMAEVLTTQLSSLNQITVQPTSAIRRYDRPEANPIEAGRELKVEAVLDGAFQKFGNQLRVTVRLLRVSDGLTLWNGKFDEDFSDIFKVQDSISSQVVEALALKLTEEKRSLLRKRYTANAAAYELYLKGRYFWNKRTAEGLQKASRYFEEAVAIYPNYAPAWAGLADCYNLLSVYDLISPRESFPKARAAAMKALELDESLAEPHASLGWIRWVYDWDWPGAEREFKRAIELNPNYPTAYYWYGACLAQRGQFDEALSKLKRAQQLEPLSLVVQVHLGWAYFYQDQYDQAIEEYQKALHLDVNFPWAHFYLGQAWEQKGMYREAVSELKTAIAFSSGRTEFLAALGHAYAESGMTVEAQKILRQLMERAQQHYISPYSIALIYVGLGEREQAFTWLHKAVEARSTRLVRLQVDPRFDKLHADPRFQELVQRIGLLPRE